MAHDEHPEAGDEWTAKAMMLGAELYVDLYIVSMWAAHMPGDKKRYYGMTQARACRKLVRAITGREE